MKKKNLFYILIIVIVLSCNFPLKNNSSCNNEQNDTSENLSPILSNGIDIADEWYRTYGSMGDDIAYDVAISPTTGNIFLAASGSWLGDMSGWEVIICDSTGNQFTGQGMYGLYQDMHPYAAESDSSGNVIVGGEYYQEINGLNFMELWKYNRTGGRIGSARWGGSLDAKCYGLTSDSSDNIYSVGEIESSGVGKSDMILVKYDSNLVEEWNRIWGGNSIDQCYDVAVDPSGNIFLAGNTWSYGAGKSDICLVKFNSTGDYQWNITWGGTGMDYCTSIDLDSTGDIYMAGYSNSFLSGSYPDICLVKYNSSGVYQWNQTWGQVEGIDRCFDLEIDLLGNIYLAGETTSYNARGQDMCLIKYNSSGERLWNCTWGGDFSESCYGITIDSSGDLYLAGYTQSFIHEGFYGSDICLVKFSSNPKITILSPQNSEYFGVEAPNFEFSILEPDLDNTWYTIDDGVTNINCGLTGQIDQTEWDQKPDGGVYIRFYAEDTQNNEAFSEVYIQKDTSPPEISIIKPISEAMYTTDPPIFNILVSDAYLNSTWYAIDNILANITINGISPTDYNNLWDQIDNTLWSGSPDGKVTIIFYAKDAAGNIASKSIIVNKGASASEQISGYNIILFLGIIGVVSVITLKKIRKFLK